MTYLYSQNKQNEMNEGEVLRRTKSYSSYTKVQIKSKPPLYIIFKD